MENILSNTKNILLNLSQHLTEETSYLMKHFLGQTLSNISTLESFNESNRIYAFGDLSKLNHLSTFLFIIEEFSQNYNHLSSSKYQCVRLGQLPININNAGVYYRNLFDKDSIFQNLVEEHDFQELTESTKSSKAIRKGIYLTNIEKSIEENQEALNFRLLRCSSNLTGPTENFRATDLFIKNIVNQLIKYDFEVGIDLNHVLAQIYVNKKKEGNNGKELKARIKAHSDKTKDMPEEGLIAFCTFYDHINLNTLEPSKMDRFDFVYKKNSGLNRLLFKLKPTVDDPNLVKEFSVTLYPNSAFIIPLSTNRLYTHEIRPSALDVDKIPTRLGYVMRCSNLNAVYKNNATFIQNGDHLVPLQPMTAEHLEDLRTTYYEENISEKKVKYQDVFFSMNTGDYEKPIY